MASSELNASAKIGQLNLFTNTAFSPNLGVQSAKFDLASGGWNGSNSAPVFSFTINTQTSSILPPTNVFIAPGPSGNAGSLGGLGFLSGAGQDLANLVNGYTIMQTSSIYPTTGSVKASLQSGGKISGQISISGAIPNNASYKGTYKANFVGSFVKGVRCN